jgi:hypothetical protein
MVARNVLGGSKWKKKSDEICKIDKANEYKFTTTLSLSNYSLKISPILLLPFIFTPYPKMPKKDAVILDRYWHKFGVRGRISVLSALCNFSLL